MPREVIIDNTTFTVSNFSAEDATEKLEEILERVIIQNAEQEFKKRPLLFSENPGNVT
jgi:hypothetical protein